MTTSVMHAAEARGSDVALAAADRLVLSPKTVRNQVADRAQAMLRAREAGLGESRR